MTKAQYKQSLRRGLGRSLLAARADPQRYRSVVLWACRHAQAFDTQMEGSRAWFTYQLVRCYDDAAPFVAAACEAIARWKADHGRTMLYLAELLRYFARDGSALAAQTLARQYETLLARLRGSACVPVEKSVRDNFTYLCIVLADDRTSFLKIAEDLGRLYRERPFYDAEDFDWLHALRDNRYRVSLERRAQKSENAAAYRRAWQDYTQRLEARSAAEKQTALMEPFALSGRLRRTADQETLLRYAQAYLAQEEPEARARALAAFCDCPFPGDPAPLIADARSACTALRRAVWLAMENLRHPLVRAAAMEAATQLPALALPVLLHNFLPADAPLVERLVTTVPVDFADTTGWHAVHRAVLAMEREGRKPPAALLRHIYETAYCSFCRESAVRAMGERRLLTSEILQECLLDSNCEIRAYARRLLRRRARRGTDKGGAGINPEIPPAAAFSEWG